MPPGTAPADVPVAVNPYAAPHGVPNPAAAAAARPKSKLPLILGIGCGLLLLLGMAGGIAAYFLLAKAKDSVTATGGPECEKLATCCKRIFQRGGSQPQQLAQCENFKQASALVCHQMVEQYNQTAQAVGITCE
jgi:hypothetical protein